MNKKRLIALVARNNIDAVFQTIWQTYKGQVPDDLKPMCEKLEEMREYFGSVIHEETEL